LPVAVDIPTGGEIKHFGLDGTTPAIWVEVDTDSPATTRRLFDIFGTGQEIPAGAKYVGTFFAAPYVWHIHEVQ